MARDKTRCDPVFHGCGHVFSDLDFRMGLCTGCGSMSLPPENIAFSEHEKRLKEAGYSGKILETEEPDSGAPK
jgi:hypothetical protein